MCHYRQQNSFLVVIATGYIYVGVGKAKKPQGKGSTMTYPCIGKPRRTNPHKQVAQTTKVAGEGSQPIVEGIIGYMYKPIQMMQPLCESQMKCIQCPIHVVLH